MKPHIHCISEVKLSQTSIFHSSATAGNQTCTHKLLENWFYPLHITCRKIDLAGSGKWAAWETMSKQNYSTDVMIFSRSIKEHLVHYRMYRDYVGEPQYHWSWIIASFLRTSSMILVTLHSTEDLPYGRKRPTLLADYNTKPALLNSSHLWVSGAYLKGLYQILHAYLPGWNASRKRTSGSTLFDWKITKSRRSKHYSKACCPLRYGQYHDGTDAISLTSTVVANMSGPSYLKSWAEHHQSKLATGHVHLTRLKWHTWECMGNISLSYGSSYCRKASQRMPL